jgi:hypothetical protein
MNRYSTRGRTLLVQFTCGRCGKTHVEPYEKQANSAEGNLQCFRPPKGWKNDSLHLPILCDDCNKAFGEFMKVGSAKPKKTCDNCANKRTHPNANRHSDCEICVSAMYPDGSESDPSHWRAKDGE